MPSKALSFAYRRLVPDTISDLMVGIKSLDAPEVVYEARLLKKLADECEASMLRSTAEKIEHAAAANDLNAVLLFVPELTEFLLMHWNAEPVGI